MCVHIYGCIHTLAWRNYLCAETGIVALLFGALQGGGPGFWRAQLLAFQEHAPSHQHDSEGLTALTHSHPYPTPSLLSLQLFSLLFGFFVMLSNGRVFVVGPSTPLCRSFQFSWLTFNSEAEGKEGQRAWNETVRRGRAVRLDHSPSHTSGSISGRGPRGSVGALSHRGELMALGVKAQSTGVYRPTLWCSDIKNSNTFLDYHLLNEPQLPFHLPLSTYEG